MNSIRDEFVIGVSILVLDVFGSCSKMYEFLWIQEQ